MSNNPLTKEKLDDYFSELSKIYRKKSHGYELEIILVGGASILLNYSFRDVTNDIDAIYMPSSEIKDAIKELSNKYDFSLDIINDDFKHTKSYSDNIRLYSTHYKTYNEALSVRTIKDEYLIAMKLVSGRLYKNDISDIAGILLESKNNSKEITYSMIDKAMKDLYGDWSHVKKNIKSTLDNLLSCNNLSALLIDIKADEQGVKKIITEFNKQNPNTINNDNINDIIKILKRK